MDTINNGSMIEHNKYEELIKAAAEEASATFSSFLPALFYHQGGRLFIVTSFPLNFLTNRVKLDSAKKGEDPNEHINRPLMPDHVRAISDYLKTQSSYILPGITLSIRQSLRCHVMAGAYPIKLGQLILPEGIQFDVTDGQHRIKALEEAIGAKPEMAKDGIAVTIVPEVDIDRIHQDFVDCAQVKPIPAALLTVFNQRDPLARFTRQIVEQLPVFKGRIEKSGKTVGKNSINLFTMNQIRAGVAELLTGDSIVASAQLKKAVDERLIDDVSIQHHQTAVLNFFQWFSEANPQWKSVAKEAGDSAKDRIDAADFRQKYVHFTATGLLIIGRVGHAILKLQSEEQRGYVEALAQINWSRNDGFWRGNVVLSNDKIVGVRAAAELAIAKIKQKLGLELTHRDSRRLEEGIHNHEDHQEVIEQ
jgi:DNA sulfur modification protein DndB